MTAKFETDPNDPPFMQLAGPLMDGISGPFNKWFATTATMGYSPMEIVKAACMVTSMQMKLLSQHVAKPGREDEFAEAVTKIILDMMIRTNASSH